MVNATPVEALSPGDHACLTFSDPEEHLDIVAAFVRDGLLHGHKVLCFTDSVSPTDLTRELDARQVPVAEQVRQGQLDVRTSDHLWLSPPTPAAPDDSAAAAATIDLLAAELATADSQGYAGLRVTADMCWATRPHTAADQLLVFETEVSKLFAGGRLTAICEYDRHNFDPVTLAFAAKAHPYTVAATVYHEDPVLRICRQHVPPGVRIAGEIDFSRADVLEQALGETLRIDHDIELNLAQLHFIDASAAAVLLNAAANLPQPRRITVVCDEAVRRVLDLVGVTDLPNVRVRGAHAQP